MITLKRLLWLLCLYPVCSASAMYNGAPLDTIPKTSPATFYKALAILRIREIGDKAGEPPWLCMGVLVAPHFVLTDGHCLANARTVEVHLFSQTNTRHPVIREAIDWVAHKNWSRASAEARGEDYNYHDVGMILISSAPGWNEPVPIAIEYDPPKDHANRPLYVVSREIAGYSEPLSPLRAVQLREYHHYSSSESPLYGGWIVQNEAEPLGLCGGDSGAPVFVVDDKGTLFLVGLHARHGGLELVKRTVHCGPFSVFYNVTYDTKSFVAKAEAYLLDKNGLVGTGQASNKLSEKVPASNAAAQFEGVSIAKEDSWIEHIQGGDLLHVKGNTAVRIHELLVNSQRSIISNVKGQDGTRGLTLETVSDPTNGWRCARIVDANAGADIDKKPTCSRLLH